MTPRADTQPDERPSLPEFLLAQLAEEERGARILLGTYDDHMATIQTGRTTMYALAPHFARWDPARVLAECEAKRRIVEECRGWMEEPGDDYGARALADTVLRHLALSYAGRRCYREEWRL